jgi:hypothetical protein
MRYLTIATPSPRAKLSHPRRSYVVVRYVRWEAIRSASRSATLSPLSRQYMSFSRSGIEARIRSDR